MFWVSIITTEARVFKEEVTALIVPGAQGYFEILTGHAPIISSLGKGLLTITRSDDSKLRLRLGGGFLEHSTKSGADITCTVLAHTLHFADQASYDSIRNLRDRLEMRLREGGLSGAEFRNVRDSFASAERLLRIAGKQFDDSKK